MIYGYKFCDEDADGTWDTDEDGIEDWAISLEGSYLGQWITGVDHTDASGRYEFSGLPDGTWTITEELRTGEGWVQTTPSTYTVTVRGGKVKGPYNFGNFLTLPAIDVTKSGPAMAHEGETITYSYTVTNTGNCPLSDVSLVDDKAGTVVTGETLAVGGSKSFTKTYKIPSDAPDPLPNTVTAEGQDELGRRVSAQDSWSVDILHPVINIVKAGPEAAHENDVITYEYTVANLGDCELSTVMVSDDVASPATYVSGDTDSDGLLDPGETWVFEASYTIPVGGDDPLVNTATDSGTDPLGLTVTAEDSWEVDILHPAIDVTKVADVDEAHVDDTVTYTITVENTGDCPLYNVLVVDDNGTPSDPTDDIIVYSDGLDIGQIETFTIHRTVTASDATPLVNIVTAEGYDNLGMKVTDSASESVEIPPEHPPSFACVFPAFGGVHVGEIKTLTFIVTNVGHPESRVYYLTLTAVIKDYTMLQFVDPYTADITIYYNDFSSWSASIDGVLTCEKFAGFFPTGDYWMVTWRVPTTYPDRPYLEGNALGILPARLVIRFQVKGIAEGTTLLQMFPRATEDHHINGVPLDDIIDKANIWGNDLWYPVHNSYDPYDEALGIGHSWIAVPPCWEPLPTTKLYAQATRLVSVLTQTTLTTTTATTEKTETKEY